MTPEQKAAMKMALKALNSVRPQNMTPFISSARTALRQALKQQPAVWVGLTDEEIYEMADNGVFLGNIKEISRDIEAKLREKNGGKA